MLAARSAAVPEALRRALNGARNGFTALFLRPGIAGRLGIAFSAVAILAVAANLTAQYGASIVRTTTVRDVQTRVEAPRPQAPPLPPPPAPAPAVVTEAPRPPAGPVLVALGQYDRALERRIEAPSAANDGIKDLEAAAAQLQDETDRFIAAATAALGAADERTRSLKTISTYSRQLRARGNDAIQAADQRRALFVSYWDAFERVDERMKGSLDRNWKIFGRVIARQSLISLSRDLDEIRRHSARLSPSGNFNAETLKQLADAQTQFAATLETHARNLGRSQGGEWLAALQADFATVVQIRGELTTADEQVSAAFSKAESAANDMAKQVRWIARPVKAVAPAPAPVSAEPAALAPSSVTPPPPPIVVTVTTPAEDHTTTTIDDHRSARIALAAVSVIVLLVLLAVCIGTVRSIVEPIRRLIATTGRLARGDADARVTRGGIRELDTLAAAFNEMAEKLNAAQTLTRDYQAQLEARVDERTRQLQHLAEHDPLTGLPNRRQFLSYLQSTLRNAGREAAQVGVFFLDLDNFKNINDSMGHAFGDLVLISIAQRLREATATGGFAARLGGDEFTIVYERAESVEEICRFGASLVFAFQKPLLVDGRDLLVGVSVGASVYPDHERDADALLRAADAALFQAKTTGRSRLSVFSPELLANASLKFRIEQGLRHAAERGEFELLFQPEVSFDVLGTKLVEALLRWRLPDGRYVPPAEFLAVAEESGLIMTISDWVLSSAIETAARWHHGPWPDVRVAINVSARQLLDTQFVDRVWNMLRQHKLPARCIEIELTENVLQTGPATVETLRRLRELGIAIALDDFGTGYSSLASLEQLPLTRVKLDRSLIASIDKTGRALAITRAIIGLCRSLGLEVTAEGVERPEQLALLVDYPSICLQGYLISKPIDSESIPTVVAQMPQRLQSLLLALPSSTESTGRHVRPRPSEIHPPLDSVSGLSVVRHAVKGS